MADPLAGTQAPSMAGALSNDSIVPTPADVGIPEGNVGDILAGQPAFAQQVATSANDLASSAPPQQAARPGAWAKNLVGGVMDALSGFSPVTRQMEVQKNARNDRLQQQAVENQRQAQQMSREDMIARATVAHENASTVYQQQLSAQLTYGNRQKNVQTGKTAIAPYLQAGAPVIQQGLDSDEINSLIQQKKIDPTKVHAFATGEKPVPGQDGQEQLDAAGNPVTRPTYTIVGDAPQVTLDAEQAALISANTPYKLPAGTKMSGLVYGTLSQQALSTQTATDSINEARDELKLKELDTQEKLAASKMLPDWSTALGKSGNDPFRALQYMETNPQMAQKYPNVATQVQSLYGGPEKWQDLRDRQIDEQLRQEEENRKIKEAQGAGDAPIPLTPEMSEKIKTLSAPAQAILAGQDSTTQAALMSVAFGENDLNQIFSQRGLYGGKKGLSRQEAAGIIQQINPNFDPTRSPIYAKARKDFAPDGKAGMGIMALNKAIPHLAQYYDSVGALSTLPGISGVARALGNQKAKDYQTTLTALSEEIAKAYKGGQSPTDQETAAWRKTLDGSTPAEARNGIRSAVHSLSKVRQAFIDQWNANAVPGTQPPMAFESPDSKAASDKILGIAPAALDVPQGSVAVQIPGQPPGHVPQANLQAFLKAHPEAKQIQ